MLGYKFLMLASGYWLTPKSITVNMVFYPQFHPLSWRMTYIYRQLYFNKLKKTLKDIELRANKTQYYTLRTLYAMRLRSSVGVRGVGSLRKISIIRQLVNVWYWINICTTFRLSHQTSDLQRKYYYLIANKICCEFGPKTLEDRIDIKISRMYSKTSEIDLKTSEIDLKTFGATNIRQNRHL